MLRKTAIGLATTAALTLAALTPAVAAAPQCVEQPNTETRVRPLDCPHCLTVLPRTSPPRTSSILTTSGCNHQEGRIAG